MGNGFSLCWQSLNNPAPGDDAVARLFYLRESGLGVNDSHDLIQLIRQATSEIAAEYQRIRARAKEDPGTAGDQGEQNWADILHKWLPTTFHVVTKGRIIFSSGQTSDQVDVLVLSPSYPKGLLNKKVYLAAGVLAAFECKNTLRREHVRKAVRTSAKLGHLSRADRSVKQHIIYGLLAHSHDIASKRYPPKEVISKALKAADEAELNDPRDCLDFICVADLGTWTLMRMQVAPQDPSSLAAVSTSYMAQVTAQVQGRPDLDPRINPDPLGRFLTSLLRRFGPIDPVIGSIAAYFYDVGLFGTGSGAMRQWELTETSEDLQEFII
jgi:hypothetical protein